MVTRAVIPKPKRKLIVLMHGIIVDGYSLSRNGKVMIEVLNLKIDRVLYFRKNTTNVLSSDQDLFC